jgi:hypothetical protein
MYTVHDTGCYADGLHGSTHLRNKLSSLLAKNYRNHPRGGAGIHWAEVEPVWNALLSDPSDDRTEERAALDFLQRQTEDGATWVIEGGDLMLLVDEYDL